MNSEHKEIEVVSGIMDGDTKIPPKIDPVTYKKIKPLVKKLLLSKADAVEVYEKLIPLLARLLDVSLEASIQFLIDEYKHFEWYAYARRFVSRVEAILSESGPKNPVCQIQRKLIMRLVRIAITGGNDEYQDRCINLLIHAVNPASPVRVKRAMIDNLNFVLHPHWEILGTIYALPDEQIRHRWIVVRDLPGTVTALNPGSEYESGPVPDKLKRTLDDLFMTNCLSPVETPDGRILDGVVTPTVLGRLFVEACTIP